MVVIILRRKLSVTVIAIVLVILTGFGLYRYKKDTSSVFWTLNNAQNSIEIFDIGRGRVTKTVPPNGKSRTEAKKILKGITGLYVKANPLPEKGFIVKVPFQPGIEVKNQWFSEYGLNPVEKMFIVFPQDDEPFILVLDYKERPYLFIFEEKTDILLDILEIERSSGQ